MNMPGFTAEASLYNVNERYQAIADAPDYGGIVQLASSHFSDVIYKDRPVLGGRFPDFNPHLCMPREFCFDWKIGKHGEIIIKKCITLWICY